MHAPLCRSHRLWHLLRRRLREAAMRQVARMQLHVARIQLHVARMPLQVAWMQTEPHRAR